MNQRAALFHSLHHSEAEGPLLLANAWDAGSARLMEQSGAKAIATTSAGVAWAAGYPDGQAAPFRVMLATIQAITRVVRIPVTADIEGGYAEDPAGVADTVTSVLEAGAVGINLEDGAGPVELLCAKIAAARLAAERAGVRLFINARTDVYLAELVSPEQRVGETLRRAALYREAGADGIFVPAVMQLAEIRELVAGVGLPLNILARPGVPPLDELRAAGVARLSAGSWLAQALLGRAAELAAAFLNTGTLRDAGDDHPLDYSKINAMMSEAGGSRAE